MEVGVIAERRRGGKDGGRGDRGEKTGPPYFQLRFGYSIGQLEWA